ncbi:MAG: beta-lactamase family protein, partial [Spirochaetia bacterium]|nr:beta-lactamase family protein [Spirochaetia bacterium]
SKLKTVSEYLDAFVKKETYPGIQYIVVNKDGVLFEYAGGWAVYEKVPMSIQSPMMMYSAGKVITAAAILRLVDQGKVNLDNPVEKFLPDLPYKNITVRQLLTHSAGIPDPQIGNFYVHPESKPADCRSLTEEAIENNRKLKFEPGTDFSYSNLGFVLLGEIIETAGGKSYQQFIRDEILDNLGISEKEASFSFKTFDSDSTGYAKHYSFWSMAVRFLLKDFSAADHGKWKTFSEHWYFNCPAHGGLIVNARGMEKFLMDQLSGRSKILSNQQTKEFYTIQKKAKSRMNRSTDFSHGWFANKNASPYYFFHEGSAYGYVSEMRIYPEKGIASMILTNGSKRAHKDLMNVVDKQFME